MRLGVLSHKVVGVCYRVLHANNCLLGLLLVVSCGLVGIRSLHTIHHVIDVDRRLALRVALVGIYSLLLSRRCFRQLRLAADAALFTILALPSIL